MKITPHNVLALACALLLTVPFAPATAGNGQKPPGSSSPREQSGRAYAMPSPAALIAQNSAPENSRGNKAKGRNADRNRDNRAPNTADNSNDAPSVSRSDAAEIAQRATGGRVLSVREDDRYWQVKVLVDEKRVRFVNVDKYSGRVR